MLWSLGGLAGIWTAVLLISFLSPVMVSGSHQERLPVVAFGTWLWGLIATAAFVWAMGKLRGNGIREPLWIGLAVATLMVWLVAAILSITLPVFVTGTDPTRIPIGGLVSPIAAAVLTCLAGVVARVFARPASEASPAA